MQAPALPGLLVQPVALSPAAMLVLFGVLA